MPGHGSKKQSRRTKGNVRPSSSSQAAQLLSASSMAPTGFVGFGTLSGTPGYVPASQALDDMDNTLDPDFRLVLRKLTKKDSTTKIKALQELSGLCKEKDEEALKAVLPFWPRMYSRTALDLDYRVREALQQALTAMVIRVRKQLAPYLRGLMGAWVLSQCDTYPTVATAATNAFQQAFPPAKQTQALVYCKQEVAEYFVDNLITQTPGSLSDPKTTETEDMEKKYQRVVTSSLLGLKKLLTSLPATDSDSLQELLSGLFSDNKFWKHGKSATISVRAAMYTLLASLCQTQAELSTLHNKKVAPFILHNIDEKDPVICPAVWEAALSLVNFVPDCWTCVNIEKAFWPKFRNLLENGFYGNASMMGSNLLPFVSKVPSDILKEDNKFHTELFDYMKLGLSKESVQTSHSECCAIVKAFLECCQYVSKATQTTDFSRNIVLDQLLPLVMASLHDSASVLHKTPLYSIMGTFLFNMEAKGSDISSDAARAFWEELGDHTLDKISSFDNNSEKENLEFTNRCIYLVKCLVYPETGLKTRVEKVKFATLLPNDSKGPTLPLGDRTDISVGASNFVQRVILKCFNMAHAHAQHTCLHLFAELIELQPSEETVCKVIEMCQGSVSSSPSHSTHFVFHVCIPWLEEVLSSDSNVTDPSQLVTVICTFVPLLDLESVLTLMEQLCKMVNDLSTFHHLLTKTLTLQSRLTSIKQWMQGQGFTDKVIAIATQVCDVSMQEIGIRDRDLQYGWDILSLILSGDGNSADGVVSQDLIQKILQIIHQSLVKLKYSQSDNRADVAIKFVSKATRSFFLNSKSCLLLSSAEDLVLSLFSISLDHGLPVTEETLSESEITWKGGIGAMVQQTGGLIQDQGILGKAVAVIRNSVNKLESLQQFDLMTQKLRTLIQVIQENLPSQPGEINSVVSSFIEQLYTNQTPVPSQQVLDYVLVSGKFAFTESPKSHKDKCPLQSIFCALCDVNLLLMSHGSETGVAGDEELELLDLEKLAVLQALYCYCVADIWINANTKTQTQQVVPPTQRLYDNICSVVNSNTQLVNNNLLLTLMDSSQHQGGQLWMVPLKLFCDMLSQDSPMTLDFSKVLDRCTDLDEGKVQMYQAIVGSLHRRDRLTMCEIMVARLISCDVVHATHVNGGFGALCSLNASLVGHSGDEIVEMLTAVITQLQEWKELDDNFILFGCDLSESSPSLILMNVQIARFLSVVIKNIPKQLTDKQWDFLMCSLVSYIQSIEESSSSLLGSTVIQTFANSVCDLLKAAAQCINDQVLTDGSNFPSNLATEWAEFFSQAAYGILLPLYIKITGDLKSRPNDGLDHVLLQSLGSALSYCPKQHALAHELPAYFIAGDLSPLPDTLQTLLNHFCPLLNHKDRAVQLTAYHLLNKIMPELPSHDKKSTDDNAESEQIVRCPPITLYKVLKESGVAMEIMLSEVKVDEVVPVEPMTEEFQYTLSYLLTWRLLLYAFRYSKAELRQEYAGFYKENGLIQQLMGNVLRLIPDIPTDRNVPGQSMFNSSPLLTVTDEGSSAEIQHMACCVFSDTLKTMPAIVRQWWREQDRRTSAYIDKFTSKHVSHILCTEEINAINSSHETLDGMMVRTRPTTREVIATYSLEEVTIEMVISLPPNHPLGNIEVSSEKRVGVSAGQWEKWLLQLKIFLQYQNGSLFDGLRIWKKNIDKRFEGVDDCMICFSVLHGTNFQLPRLQCRTCKKKFHSACLYKWFQTSHNSTCPLCRNLF